MKEKFKKGVACLLVMMLVVTSMCVNGIQGRADETLDVSEITTDIAINSGGPSFDITAATREIGGVTYKNYATYQGVSVNATNEELRAAANVIDGNADSRWETTHGVDPVELVVDFGNVYSLKSIAISWEGASSKTYEVWVSKDGSNFTKVTDVESNTGRRTDELTFSRAMDVRSVKLNCTSRVTVYGHSIYEMAFYGDSEQGKVVPILSNLQVKDYYKYSGKYMLYFTEPENVKSYNVYIDDNETPIANIEGSGSYIDADDLAGISAGDHTLSIASVDEVGNQSSKISKKITIGDKAGNYNDIAQLYIYTAKNISQDYHKEKDVTITILDENGDVNVRDALSNIKIRGNTTAGYVKKPWNIKLNKKTKVLGMPKGKKWCVLANAFDRSLMRNRLSYQMGLENGISNNCESRYVDVYVNGKFNGNYLITEPVETGDGRTEIDPYNADNLDILLEYGTRNEPDVDHFTTTMGITFDVNEPEKGDDLTDEQVNAKIERVKAYLSEFETVLKGAKGYEVKVFKTKKNAINNKKAIVRRTIKKSKVTKITVKSKKLNKKRLYVRVRAYVLKPNGKKVYGKWSKIKRVVKK